jgi:hypothetical protein
MMDRKYVISRYNYFFLADQDIDCLNYYMHSDATRGTDRQERGFLDHGIKIRNPFGGLD